MSRARSRASLVGLGLLLATAIALLIAGDLDRDVAAKPAAEQHAVSPRTPAPRTIPSRSARRSPNVYAAITNAAALSSAVRGIPTRVYVPDNASNDVRVIDPRTFRVVRTFHVGMEPQHITPAWNMKHLYVGNVYSNSLTVIDPRTARPIRTIQTRDPCALDLTPDGRHAIDVGERQDTLYFYDPTTGRLQG